ncbi:MAG: hypothetical protein FWC46_04175, partial [Actinomycetia bacterium]|nr:hypothetical protein [Actinomycetes bacterium]
MHSPLPGVGVPVLLLVSLLAGCTARGAPASSPSGSDAASPGVLSGPTASGAPAATSSRPSATASAPQPPGDMGVVFVAQTLVDAFMGTTITVQLAQTVWVPAVAATPVTPGPVRMTGIRIQVRSDASPEAPAVDGSGFSLIAADGASTAPCAALPTGGADEARSLAVLAGIAGDRRYTFDPATGGGEGWI